MSNSFEKFVGLYPVSKTLRFELRPVGKTLENFHKTGFLEHDLEKAKAYPVVKKIIDDFHKSFITKSLSNAALNWQPLADALQKARSENDRDLSLNKTIKTCQDELRRDIVANYFEKSPEWNYLFKKELIQKLLESALAQCDKDNEEALKIFKNFSGYFLGFHENRKNFYVKDAQSTAIAYRLVHDNFPRFMNNCMIWKKINERHPDFAKQMAFELQPVLNGRTLDEIFTISAYNRCLTQPGIDAYNLILGGYADDLQEVKKQGINELLNLFYQQNPEFSKSRIGWMTPLYKQILSDRETFSFQLNAIESDENLAKIVEKLYAQWFPTEGTAPVVILCSMLNRLGEFDAGKIWVKALALSAISQKLYGSWNLLRLALESYAENAFSRKNERERFLNRQAYSIGELSAALQQMPNEENAARPPVTDYWKDFSGINESLTGLYRQAQSALAKDPEKAHSLRERTEDVEKVKSFLDGCMDFLHTVEPFSVSEELSLDERFYGVFNPIYEQLEELPGYYNMVRNYITQKLNGVQKVKLNFDCPTLANGWDQNKENGNLAVLLMKGGNYYLGIINAQNKVKFTSLPQPEKNDEVYRKMVYKLLPSPEKMLPKVFFSKKGLQTFDVPSDILSGYKSGKHKPGVEFDPDFCRHLIDFYQKTIAIHPDWKGFNFHFSAPGAYPSIAAFYNEIADQGYMISFQDISSSQIDMLVDSGKLFLFQIYNKDFSPKAFGKPNLHTMYWRALFAPENLADVVFKLNGEAELFYRKAVLQAPSRHAAGSKLVNRSYRDGNGKICTIPENVYQELLKNANGTPVSLSPEAQAIQTHAVIKTADRELIKDRRYTEDKFQFHVPITMNFKASGKMRVNDVAWHYLSEHPETRVIGIDRGERNLLYLCVLDENGQIIEQRSLNLVGNVDYQNKLDQRERARDNARKSWQEISSIKELKSGYLSQVVNEIVTLMIRHHAIVVLEDLNFGFKRGRFKVEKQVYQKFERALIEKLNYLVFKDFRNDEAGGIFKGYQLTEKFQSFQRLGKQSGLLFYVPAHYTSKIDPATGFVSLFPLYDLNNMPQRQTFFGKFDSISFDGTDFLFRFDYRKIGTEKKSWRNEWTLTSAGTRLKYNPATKETAEVAPTELLKHAFSQYGLEFLTGRNLVDELASLPHDRKAESLFKELLDAFRLIVQLRNSRPRSTAPEADYILSPVPGRDRRCFDSRIAAPDMPQDADANGAFHIALKGRLLLERFAKAGEERTGKPESGRMDSSLLKISNDEWLQYIQSLREK